MNLDFNNFYKYINQVIKGSTIDLSNTKFIHPWSMVMLCLLLTERMNKTDKKLILPQDSYAKSYLKRMRLDKILVELGYLEEAKTLEAIDIPTKDNLNVQELQHCFYRDEFNARLNRFISMFENFGLDQNEAQRATSVVGELGNNVFDHNLGNWPTRISGCIIAAQNYPTTKRIEIAVGDSWGWFLWIIKNGIS